MKLRHNNKKLLILSLLVIGTGFLVFLSSKVTYFRSNASSSGSLEGESGVITNNIQIVNDTSASNGQYLVLDFGTDTSTPTQPTPTKTPTPTLSGSTITPTRTPTPIPTKSFTPTPTLAGTASYPAQILNLTNWKETLPTGSSGHPTEILQPQLATYKIDPWFVVSQDGRGVQFRAPVNGITTSGSSYPRSELREMTNNGQSQASWSSTSGTHTMTIDEAITAVPKTKRHIVAGQIHDASDDVIVIRLEYPKLFVDINGTTGPTLDANYTLGKRFTVKFVVNGGKTNIYYNGSGTAAYTLSQSYSGAYFKAGAYTQSNCTKEASSDCTSSNYGEVIIYNVTVTHQ